MFAGYAREIRASYSGARADAVPHKRPVLADRERLDRHYSRQSAVESHHVVRGNPFGSHLVLRSFQDARNYTPDSSFRRRPFTPVSGLEVLNAVPAFSGESSSALVERKRATGERGRIIRWRTQSMKT